MQVDPIKPKLTLPGTKRLKLKCDVPLSKFAFNFNLRRYNEEIVRVETENASLRERLDEAAAAAEDGRAPGPASYAGDDGAGKGRAVQIDLIKPELKPRLVAALETKL